jgi:hypothetical protein
LRFFAGAVAGGDRGARHGVDFGWCFDSIYLRGVASSALHFARGARPFRFAPSNLIAAAAWEKNLSAANCLENAGLILLAFWLLAGHGRLLAWRYSWFDPNKTSKTGSASLS